MMTWQRTQSSRLASGAALHGRAAFAASKPRLAAVASVLLAGLLAASPGHAQTPPGTEIANVATATYGAGGLDELAVTSNPVVVTVTAPRTAAELVLLRRADPVTATVLLDLAPPGYSASGTELGPFVPMTELPDAALGPVDLVPETVFHQNDVIFLRLADADQNRDPSVAESVLVVMVCAATGEREWLQIAETGPATGEFAGFVQGRRGRDATVGDGVLTLSADATILARYQDPDTPADQANARASVDPVALVFDARTGAPVNGARVTLLDATSGAPANVRGDDGVSVFPATVVSGGTLSDTGGAEYDFPAGGYRFPYVEPGLYRLVVEPPPGYLAPSAVADTDLQTLPGAPFALDAAASRGEPFSVPAGPPLQVDIPLDPAGGTLFLTKTAGKAVAAVGEWVPWELRLANTGQDDAGNLMIVDELPPRFRYEPGSLRIGGTPAADPELASDGRSLTIALPGVAADAAVTVRYVTAVLVGAQPGEAAGTARAWYAGEASNAARASVLVQDDLFAERCLLVGRVAVDACADTDPDSTRGVAGVRLYLEDGTSVVTDARGRYHVEGVRPGAHILQLDIATLPGRYAAGPCRPDPHRAVHPFARYLDLQAGTTWRTDFVVHEVAPDTGAVGLELAMSLVGRRLDGVLTLGVGAVPLRDLRPTVMLPEGTTYTSGSSRLDGEAVPDPEDRGGVLVWRLGDAESDRSLALTFAAHVDSVHRANLETSALLVADSPTVRNARTGPVRAVCSLVPDQIRERNPEVVLHPHFGSLQAVLTPADEADVDSLAADLVRRRVLAVRVVGHTDSQGIPARHRHQFADNHALGLARARAVADRLARTLDLAESQLHVFSRGPDEPIADNGTSEGRALNRRVVVQAWTESVRHRLPDHPVRDRADTTTVVVGLRPGDSWGRSAAPAADPDVMPDFDMAWLERAAPGFELLWPPEGFHPAIPSTKTAAKHDPSLRLSLEVNGVVVDRINFDGTARNTAGDLAVTRWAGVDLVEGPNRIVVVARDSSGTVHGRVERSIHFSGAPVRLELVPAASDLVASGQRSPIVAVRLLDRDGHPARRGVIGEFSVDAPYEPERIRSEEEKARLAELEQRRPTYTVGRDGIAEIRLEPTTRTGEVVLRVPLAGSTEEVRAWLEPEPRDWILVGIAEGTAGWNTVAGNVEGFAEAGGQEEFHHDGRVAFFARGRVKGKWLLTAAFDSREKGATPADRSLDGVVDPDAYYDVYGDASVQTYDAATTDKLYVKLERREFFALYGDLTTGMTVTELGRYNRRLTGVQAGYRHGVLDATGFASRSRHAYGRDEIPGDGTSGIYRLATGAILIGSETVTIEVRDRYRPEVVLSERRLSRIVDYDIDYDRGELVFKEPVFARDEQFNSVWIVAEYETWDDRDPETTGGGRAAVHLGGDRVEAGATVVHEGGHGTGGDLAAFDARVDVTDAVRVKAELAGSDREDAGRAGAWLAEVQARSARLDARAWARRQETGFGLGQQRQGRAGTFMAGAEADWRFLAEWTLAARLAHREDLESNAEQDLVESRLTWSRGALSANLGHRYAEDRFAAAADRRSQQLRGGAAVGLFRNRLRLRADHEHNLGEAQASADYPTRTAAGVEYQIVPQATVQATREWTDSGGYDTRSTRLGLKTVPWAGGEATTSMEQRYREGDLRIWRNAGIKQVWRIDERWSLDGGVDHAQVQGDAPPAVDTGTPPAGGPTSDYTAFALGVTCRGANWRWTQRGELRNADQDKWALEGSVYVEPSRSVGLQAGVRVDRRDLPLGHDHRAAARLGFAWRPHASPWSLLQRLDWKVDDSASGSAKLESRRLVQNLSLVWRRHTWLQLSGRYGWRQAVETIDGARYQGYTDIAGLEGRWFFSRRWDLGLQAAARNSWSRDVHDLSLGVSAGLNVLEDLWLSLGWNIRGFRDRDFDAAGWTAQGPFVRFRFRFNQESTREMLF